MAQFIDLRFEELVKGAPRIIREGLTGTKTMVLPEPNPNRALIVEYSSKGRVIGTWPIKNGWAYRVNPKGVKRLPFIEQDPDPLRRFCRKNSIALTKIIKCQRGEKVDFGRPRCQGETGYRVIKPNDPPVLFVRVWTTGNPEWVFGILVAKGEEPKSYEEFCAIAQNWECVKSGQYDL